MKHIKFSDFKYRSESDTTALERLFAYELEDGDTLEFAAGSAIDIEATRQTDKAFHIVGNGAVINRNSAALALRLKRPYVNPLTITAIVEGAVNRGGDEAMPVVTCTVVGTPPPVGARVKVFSDDKIKGMGGTDRRIGVFATVVAVSGQDVTLDCRLIDFDLPAVEGNPFITNPRMATIREGELTVKDLNFDGQNSAGPGVNAGFMSVEGYIEPRAKRVRGKNGDASGLAFIGTYLARSRGCRFINMRNAPAEGCWGYGVYDVSSYGSYHEDLSGSLCRTVYTTGAFTNPGTDYTRYGRTMFPTIRGGYADNTAGGFSTHSDAFGAYFENIVASNIYDGPDGSACAVGIRGMACTVNGLRAVNCGYAVQVHEDFADSTNYTQLFNIRKFGTGKLLLANGHPDSTRRMQVDVFGYNYRGSHGNYPLAVSRADVRLHEHGMIDWSPLENWGKFADLEVGARVKIVRPTVNIGGPAGSHDFVRMNDDDTQIELDDATINHGGRINAAVDCRNNAITYSRVSNLETDVTTSAFENTSNATGLVVI